MYRNIIHKCGPDTNWQSVIHLFTWDEDGTPCDYEITYSPHLYYVPNKDTLEISEDYTTVTGKPLVKKEFNNIFERKKWIETHPTTKLYDCWNPEMAFLRDYFAKDCETDKFSQFPLKVYALDIETTVGAKFPDAENPTEAITCLTVADTRTFESWTWLFLTAPWKKNLTKENFKNHGSRKYFVFDTEHQMYTHFLNWFKNNRPDILTGWNIDSFDIPFLVNRISSVLSSEEVADAFSPVGKMRKLFIKHNVKARPYTSYRFEGLTSLDYMILYRDKFCKGSMVADYKLDTICMEELGVGKLEYDCSFKEFYEGDFKKFIEYNIIDVIRICDLEKKLKLIALTRYMCNTSLIPYEKIMAVQPVVIGALEILMRNQGQLIMSDDRVDPELKSYPFEGAFVFSRSEYKSGPFTSFDLNSLYPNIIMSINISPETYVGQILNFDFNSDEWEVSMNGKVKVIPKEKFIERFREKLNIAGNGSLYMKRKYRIGMCAQFEDKFYKGRKEVKKKMLQKEAEAAELLKKIKLTDKKFKYDDPLVKLDTEDKKKWAALNDEAAYYSVAQLGMKTNLNSLYGLFSSKFSPICHMPSAAAITKSGQVIIQSSMKFLNNEMETLKKLNES
jgi:DNA polymerase elongation subunit (family B)